MIFLIILILTLFSPFFTAQCAIFSNDSLHFFLNNERITDNSVIAVHHPPYQEEKWELCERGRYYIRQGPDWHAGPYTFTLVSKPDLLTYREWARSEDGIEAGGGREAYGKYLRKFTQYEVLSVDILVPDEDAEPALDTSPPPPPRPGMDEGRLGFNRYFRVDLESGNIIQLAKNPLTQDIGISGGTTLQDEICTASRCGGCFFLSTWTGRIILALIIIMALFMSRSGTKAEKTSAE